MHPMYDLGQTCTAVWERRVTLSADQPFLHCKGKSWTYRQANIEVLGYASLLSELGVKQGTRVLVGMTNRAEALFVHFALARLAAINVGLVPGSTFTELAYVVNHSQATFLVADDPIAGLLLPQLSTFERKLEIVLTSELSNVSVRRNASV